MLRHPQAVQVGLLPAAAALPGRVEVVGEEGPRGAAVGGGPLAVGLRVPLIGQVVGVFEGAVLMGGCRHTEELVPASGGKNDPVEPRDPGWALPGGPGADRDGMFWWVLEALERP